MAAMSATDAKNKFGQLLEMAQREPVHIQKNGRDVGILVSPEEYVSLTGQAAGPQANPHVIKAHTASLKRWDRVYKALAK